MGSDFSKSLRITLPLENVYSNNPADPGGETVWGISRNEHSEWEGWALIDQLKNQPSGFPIEAIAAEPNVMSAVRRFYKREFWDKIDGDYWSDQHLADLLFDCAVNLSPKTAGELLQKSLNMLNWNQARYPDIEVDGNIGPVTIATMGALAMLEPRETLTNMYCEYRSHAYLIKAEEHPEKEKFIKGWLNRNRKLMAQS